MLPQVLHDFGVFVDGKGYFGIAKEVEPPKFKIVTEEHLASGMAAPIELDMGLEKLELKMTFAGYNKELASMLGLLNADTPITLRGAIHRQGEGAVPVVIQTVGGCKESDPGSWKRKDPSTTVLVFTANTYTETIDGTETKFIDKINGIRRINGVDQMEQIRAAIGQ